MIIKRLGSFNLKRVRIGVRLGIGMGLIIAFMVMLTGMGIWSLSAMNGKLEGIMSRENAKIALAHEVQAGIGSINKSVFAIGLANDPSLTAAEKQKIDQGRTLYMNALEKLQKLETAEKGKNLIADIKGNVEIVKNTNDKAIELVASGSAHQAASMIVASLDVVRILESACNEMVKYQEERTAVAAKEAHATYVKGRYILLVMGAVVFAFAIFLASFIARSVTKPLGEGVSIAQRIAQGDLTVHIETSATDETGQLLVAMQHMASRLQDIIGEVKMATGDMASSVQQLNSSSELMSKGAREQAARASQVATASVQTSQTLADIAKNTSSIGTSATETAKLAKDGEVVVDRSVDKVKSIANTISQSAKLMTSLGQRSDQIGKIINVINDIADQTNLLALNAAIEAARAGDMGRGFAVVADEVKKLAERTGNSTAEIGGMVKSIQDEVHEVVSAMENITEEVKSGVDLASQTGDVLRGIIASVDELHTMVQQIVAATEEMAATSEEINRDIETIASVSKETSTSSEDIANASQGLATLSINLEKVVAEFRV